MLLYELGIYKVVYGTGRCWAGLGWVGLDWEGGREGTCHRITSPLALYSSTLLWACVDYPARAIL